MLTLEQNIRAVIETCFSESKEELQEIATQQIIGLIESNASNTLKPLETHWIPCSERLPEGQTEVIVSCADDSGDTPFSYTSCGWITTDGEYWIVDNEINSFVQSWMPLPKPMIQEK